MKRSHKITIGIASAALLSIGLLAWQPLYERVLKNRCASAGGKWTESEKYCIAKDCAENGSCRPSYRNNEACGKLKPGITANEAYFQLGMPTSVSGNDYVFQGGALGQSIHATIKDDKVERLECGK